MKKRLTLEELRERRDDVDQGILRVRKLLETHKAERDKIYSVENRRRMSPQGLAEDEGKLRRKTEQQLATLNALIAKDAREASEDRHTWSYEHELRTSRFAPESNANALTEAAQLKAIFNEVMETFKRGNAENRAARFTTEDLITETERAALNGEVATLAVFAQAARNRKLEGLEKLSFDTAFKKLQLPEIDEATEVFSHLDDLATEADALFTLWKEPRNETALTGESLGRFNRRKRAEAIVRAAEEEGQQKADAKQQHAEAQARAAEVTKPIPVPAVIEPPPQAA